MPTFRFKSTATETTQGTAYFEVEAKTEDEARAKLADDACEYYTDFNEMSGNVDWDAEKPDDFELL